MNRWLVAAFVSASGLLAAGLAAADDACAPPEDPDLRCLALNVYWEARGRQPQSQQAVAHTSLNRAAHSAFPDSVCGVVKDGGEETLHACQFSWWCDGKSDEPTESEAWCEALTVAREALAGRSRDPTGGALYFHLATVEPDWAKDFQQTARIGDHIYYK